MPKQTVYLISWLDKVVTTLPDPVPETVQVPNPWASLPGQPQLIDAPVTIQRIRVSENAPGSLLVNALENIARLMKKNPSSPMIVQVDFGSNESP